MEIHPTTGRLEDSSSRCDPTPRKPSMCIHQTIWQAYRTKKLLVGQLETLPYIDWTTWGWFGFSWRAQRPRFFQSMPDNTGSKGILADQLVRGSQTYTKRFVGPSSSYHGLQSSKWPVYMTIQILQPYSLKLLPISHGLDLAHAIFCMDRRHSSFSLFFWGGGGGFIFFFSFPLEFHILQDPSVRSLAF